jgi:hypothetical protein
MLVQAACYRSPGSRDPPSLPETSFVQRKTLIVINIVISDFTVKS